MTRVGVLASISIDCADPDALAPFYRSLLGIEEAFAFGAAEAAHQPDPDRWRVLIDPAGHPFCLTTVRPD